MSRGHAPKFVKHFAELGDAIVGATRAYVDEVRAGTFPAKEHEYASAEPTVVPDAIAH
jgi:3-methyl-2-oxobutanoate hydroxymethyltransferase